MYCVVLQIAYLGTAYSGLVLQDNAPTVCGALLSAIHRLDPDVTHFRVASRTDAGVHARQQFVAFDTSRELPLRGWSRALARYLPADVAVRVAFKAPSGFNPRFETTAKTYQYWVLTDPLEDPFFEGRAWRVHHRLGGDALTKMRSELSAIEGTHDFRGFASAHDQRPTSTRTLSKLSLSVARHEPRLLVLQLTGSGFLHNMVRIIAGSVVDVGRGRRPVGTLQQMLDSKDRTQGGVTAPPVGLYLHRVGLKAHDFERWPPPNA